MAWQRPTSRFTGAHAALDCAPGIGTADALAELLGVTILGRFAEYVGGRAGIHGTNYRAALSRL